MKTEEDFLKEAIGEIRYALDGSVTKAELKWAMEEYAKYYHETEVKKLHKPDVSGSLVCPNCGSHLQVEMKEMNNSEIIKALKTNDR